MIKILTVVGARPQFIKASALSRHLQAHSDFEEVFLHTGQHYDAALSDLFFEELDLPSPHYHLNTGSGNHGSQTGFMLAAIEEILIKEKPDRVLIYGDTNSTLAAALAAVKLHIPIAHVEAGLRLYDLRVPEEVNRLVADQLSDMLFTPTDLATANLIKEGINPAHVHQVGDVMLDVALYYGEKAEQKSQVLHNNHLISGEYVLATVHRPENTDDKDKLQIIMQAFSQVSEQLPVVLPLHPRTEKMLKQYNMLQDIPKNVRIIEPQGFLDMIMLEKNAAVIATDSGGVQKEAFFYKVPSVILYDKTVWTELVDLGWNTVIAPESAALLADGILKARTIRGSDTAMPYGDGLAGEKIIRCLEESLHAHA